MHNGPLILGSHYSESHSICPLLVEFGEVAKGSIEDQNQILSNIGKKGVGDVRVGILAYPTNLIDKEDLNPEVTGVSSKQALILSNF